MKKIFYLSLMLFSGSAFAGFSIDGIDVNNSDCSSIDNKEMSTPIYFSSSNSELAFFNIKEMTFKGKSGGYLTAYCNTDNGRVLSVEVATSKEEYETTNAILSDSYNVVSNKSDFLGDTTVYQGVDQVITLRMSRKHIYTIRVDRSSETYSDILAIKESSYQK